MSEIILGLSGGVDSALAAKRLQNAGFSVTGVYCVMHEAGREGVEAARAVAENIGIKFDTVDLTDEFEKIVVTDFIKKYTSGRTPNPCVVCNPNVKFRALTAYADNVGAERIATGHYAGVTHENGRWCAVKSEHKDQSYMLCGLTQDELSRCIFPLFNSYKPENREEAAAAGIEVSGKRDSQEICFIPDNDHAAYINARTEVPQGDFILDGQVVGQHKGIINYTVGQTKKLGIALGVPLYVKKLDAENNSVILSKTDVTDCSFIECEDAVFQLLDNNFTETDADVKIRYAHKGARAHIINKKNGRLSISFYEPQRAATPGQYAVAYRDGKILCAGMII